MNIVNLINRSNDVMKLKKESNSMEVEIIIEYINKYVKMYFDKVSDEIPVFKRKKLFNSAEVVHSRVNRSRNFVVLKHEFNDDDRCSKEWSEQWGVGYLLGIDRRGRIVEGNFIKDYKLMLGQHYYVDIDFCENIETVLNSKIITPAELLERMSLEDFQGIIFDKLKKIGVAFDNPEDAIEKEQRRIAILCGMLQTLRNAN